MNCACGHEERRHDHEDAHCSLCECASFDEAREPEPEPPVKPAVARPRPLAEILKALQAPIKPRHLKQKVKGGAKLDFIPWYHAIKYLDLHAPGWSHEIRQITWHEGRIVLTVRLTIPAAEGLVYREATGTEEEPEDGRRQYGDPSSNAESMALRRAAAKFGLGLYLYNKDGNK